MVIVEGSILGDGRALYVLIVSYVVIVGGTDLGNGCTLYVVIVGGSVSGNGCT